MKNLKQKCDESYCCVCTKKLTEKENKSANANCTPDFNRFCTACLRREIENDKFL